MSTLQEFHNLADSPFFCTLAAKGFAHVSVVRCWIYRILICKWAAKKHAAPPVECGLAGRKMDFFRVRFHWEGMNVVLLGNCEKWKFRRFRMHKSKNSTSSSISSFYWWKLNRFLCHEHSYCVYPSFFPVHVLSSHCVALGRRMMMEC